MTCGSSYVQLQSNVATKQLWNQLSARKKFALLLVVASMRGIPAYKKEILEFTQENYGYRNTTKVRSSVVKDMIESESVPG